MDKHSFLSKDFHMNCKRFVKGLFILPKIM